MEAFTLTRNGVQHYVRKSCKLINLILIIYTVKRWNKLPAKYAKLMYMFLSPLLLTRAFLESDLISNRYRRFLLSFTYPNAPFKQNFKYGSCESVHSSDETCNDLIRKEWKVTVRNVINLYTRFYIVQALLLMLLTRTVHLKTRISDTVKSILRSTMFLGGQTLLQRHILCAANQYGIQIDKPTMFGLCAVGSVPVVFERSHRVRQINGLMICHLIIGTMRKYSVRQCLVSYPAFLFTMLEDNFCINPATMLMAMGASAVF